jgi:hypothetical protein
MRLGSGPTEVRLMPRIHHDRWVRVQSAAQAEAFRIPKDSSSQ